MYIQYEDETNSWLILSHRLNKLLLIHDQPSPHNRFRPNLNSTLHSHLTLRDKRHHVMCLDSPFFPFFSDSLFGSTQLYFCFGFLVTV